METLSSAAARAKSVPKKFGLRECAVLSAVKTYVDGTASSLNDVLVGFSAGAGTVSAADTVLSAFNKIDANSRLASKQLLTDFSAAGGTIAATDSSLQAFQKLVGNMGSGTTGTAGNAGKLTIANLTATGAVVVTALEDISGTPFCYAVCNTGYATLFDTSDAGIAGKRFAYIVISYS